MLPMQPTSEELKVKLHKRISPILRADCWPDALSWQRFKAFYHVTSLRFRRVPAPTVFASIYHQNIWNGDESVSGKGSDLRRTATLIKVLPELLREVGAQSLLDAACGDFHWMKEVELPVEHYTGVDIIPELIARNNREYGNASRSFIHRNLMADDLPKSDVIMCRDCLVHLSYADARQTIENFRRSGSTYLLTTTFDARNHNLDINTGNWRPLNLELPPFNFGPPLKLIREDCDEDNGAYRDKSLGLWRLADLPL